MKDKIRTLSSAIRVLTTVALWLSATGLVLMTAFIAWQVYGRFVLNDTPTWTETSSVLLMGWFILLGAAVGIREGNHLSFDVLLFVLPDRVKRVFYTVSDIVVIAFALGMVVYGIQLASNAWSTTIPNLGFSGGIVFLALICGGILMVLFSVERILRRMVGLPTARFGEDPVEED
ncbi:TRAP transporter small permease [Marinibacterium profundimaris]|uniref:TRAP transporter small permease protein n=1 Tax=Marinibacterium profundimaris TaxID=1679460 RepID=A0A225NEI9_9RHOB|nr:TRAP transporter small permease [Marinibacterium profundimaris]OWU71023.1 C4-dicarboxylate ABC transporter [Marinibacterium profundimaris]